MKNEYEMFELIDRYLEGSMTKEEIQTFENNLKTDHELAKEFELAKAFQQVIRTYGYKEKVANIHQVAMKEYYISENLKKMRYLGVALFVIFLLSCALIGALYSPAEQLSKEVAMLIDAKASKQYDCAAARSNSKAKRFPILDAYSVCDYRKAIQLYSAAPKQIADIKTIFFAGNAYVAVNDLHGARDVFARIAYLPKEGYSEVAKWYLANIDLQHGNPTSAETFIQDETYVKREALQWMLISYYLKTDQVSDADRVLSGMKNSRPMLSAKLKILKIKKGLF